MSFDKFLKDVPEKQQIKFRKILNFLNGKGLFEKKVDKPGSLQVIISDDSVSDIMIGLHPRLSLTNDYKEINCYAEFMAKKGKNYERVLVNIGFKGIKNLDNGGNLDVYDNHAFMNSCGEDELNYCDIDIFIKYMEECSMDYLQNNLCGQIYLSLNNPEIPSSFTENQKEVFLRYREKLNSFLEKPLDPEYECQILAWLLFDKNEMNQDNLNDDRSNRFESLTTFIKILTDNHNNFYKECIEKLCQGKSWYHPSLNIEQEQDSTSGSVCVQRGDITEYVDYVLVVEDGELKFIGNKGTDREYKTDWDFVGGLMPEED